MFWLTGPMGRELVANDCLGKCEWSRTDLSIEQRAVFGCGACGSEWTHDQSWTPRNADGEINPEVTAERAAHPVPSSPW